MERILHINDYPADVGGGAEVTMGRTIDLLRRRGLVVEAFTSADVPHARRTPLAYIDNRAVCDALAARLEAFKPDVVHLHNIYHALSPGILAVVAERKRSRRLRVVMTAHDYHLVCPNSGGDFFRHLSGRRVAIESGRLSLGALLARRWDQRGLLHSSLKLAQHLWNYRWHERRRTIDLVICPSRFVQGMLEPIGVPTCVLPHPAPTLLVPMQPRGPELSFVYAGRLELGKGIDDFLEVVPTDLPARLTIVGTGCLRERCQRICAARGLTERVRFLGRLPHADTLAEIARAHVLVQPSRMLETYGLTLIEALAVGTNVLANDRGAARELIEDAGVGYLFDLDDPHSVAAALEQICHSHKSGTLNRFDVAAFLEQRSERVHIDRLMDLYQDNAAASTPLAA